VSRPRERIAAIDVGSNTILLTVAELDPDLGLVMIEEAEDQPRLGAGLAATGRLGDEAMQRALESLTRIRDTCRRLRVTRIGAVATAAVREASNGSEFVARVQALDIPLRVIPPETEAALSYRSAAHHFPGGGPTLAADIGGGSLELIGARNGRVVLTQSFLLGAVRLTERRLPLSELQDAIRNELESTLEPGGWTGSTVIGSGGTFTTLARIAQARRGEVGRSVHGVSVTTAEVRRLMLWLAEMSPAGRQQVPGLKPERADIIVAGLAVALQLLESVAAESVTVSGYGIRDGVLLEMVGLE
jgi:exopolyphosphatase / guanosine-5'-triphosphate,3'-diphosphate pyrophosphatase